MNLPTTALSQHVTRWHSGMGDRYGVRRLRNQTILGDKEAALGHATAEKDWVMASSSNGTGPTKYPGADLAAGQVFVCDYKAR